MKAEDAIPFSPFHCPIPVRRLSRSEFDELSRLVMAHVFASQNELGHLCDEGVYQNDIALRLEAAGLEPVAKEVPVTVSWRDFAKTFYLDLVVQAAFVMELKALGALSKEHDAQLLNYLLLLDVPHGKLVNLRPPSVEYRTVNNVVSAAERRRFALATGRWQTQTPRCHELRDGLVALLEAWGVFLDCRLYEEALIHVLGGETRVIQRVLLARAGVALGFQPTAMLTDQVAFRVTALSPQGRRGYEADLQRFLALTKLTALHWINLHHHDVHLVTITR